MAYADWPRDEVMSKRIDTPGLNIVHAPELEGQDYYGVYYPPEVPKCPTCHVVSNANGYTDVRQVYDIMDAKSGTPQIVSIRFQRQRYICPCCGKEVLYTPDFVAQNNHVTDRLENYIGQMCLDRSPEKVAEQIGNQLSESAIRNIFSRWHQVKLAKYRDGVTAPKALGMHMVTVGANSYCLLTDLEGKNLIDIFEWTDKADLYWFVASLAYMQRTHDVVADIDPACLMNAKGTFSTSTICVALCSVYRFFATELSNVMAPSLPPKVSKDLLSWIQTPLYDDHTLSTVVRNYLNQLANKHDEKRTWFSLLNSLQINMLTKMQEEEFTNWKSDISRFVEFSKFVSFLNLAKNELHNAFLRTSFESAYTQIEKIAVDVIRRSQKAKFATLRARLLLTLQPTLLAPDGQKHTGISFELLYNTLKEYEE